ncbi:phosphopantetheine-binding protein [Streptomyces sp. B6B3]|uniref:acyl carrier protein n=1 Tax=Streptomyces sp. B6B3 TaxID=3153570 RepID=UPI00325D7AD5
MTGPHQTTAADQRVRESALTHPDVREALAFRHDDAWALAVVPVRFTSVIEIREHLWSLLAEDGPALVALVDALPADPDAFAATLPTLPATRITRFVPPHSELERTLCAMVAESVGVPDASRVGLDDDFLDLGADSMSVIQLVTLVQESLGVELPLEEAVDAGSVRALAHAVSSRSGRDA